ncbi:MAG: hypothetical protein KDK66_06800 [Deltaproteobacteria bacterium]|nr:hypothetical protein [Deltaproteobacteria bacterium]
MAPPTTHSTASKHQVVIYGSDTEVNPHEKAESVVEAMGSHDLKTQTFYFRTSEAPLRNSQLYDFTAPFGTGSERTHLLTAHPYEVRYSFFMNHGGDEANPGHSNSSYFVGPHNSLIYHYDMAPESAQSQSGLQMYFLNGCRSGNYSTFAHYQSWTKGALIFSAGAERQIVFRGAAFYFIKDPSEKDWAQYDRNGDQELSMRERCAYAGDKITDSFPICNIDPRVGDHNLDGSQATGIFKGKELIEVQGEEGLQKATQDYGLGTELVVIFVEAKGLRAARRYAEKLKKTIIQKHHSDYQVILATAPEDRQNYWLQHRNLKIGSHSYQAQLAHPHYHQYRPIPWISKQDPFTPKAILELEHLNLAEQEKLIREKLTNPDPKIKNQSYRLIFYSDDYLKKIFKPEFGLTLNSHVIYNYSFTTTLLELLKFEPQLKEELFPIQGKSQDNWEANKVFIALSAVKSHKHEDFDPQHYQKYLNQFSQSFLLQKMTEDNHAESNRAGETLFYQLTEGGQKLELDQASIKTALNLLAKKLASTDLEELKQATNNLAVLKSIGIDLESLQSKVESLQARLVTQFSSDLEKNFGVNYSLNKILVHLKKSGFALKNNKLLTAHIQQLKESFQDKSIKDFDRSLDSLLLCNLAKTMEEPEELIDSLLSILQDPKTVEETYLLLTSFSDSLKQLAQSPELNLALRVKILNGLESFEKVIPSHREALRYYFQEDIQSVKQSLQVYIQAGQLKTR